MKSVKRILSLVLIMLLIMSIAAPALAVGAEEPDFHHYFMLGDSIALKCHYETSDKSGLFGFSKDTYGELLIKHYGIEDAYNCAWTGWRTHEGRIVLDPSYTGDDYTEIHQPNWGHDDLAHMQKMQPTAMSKLENADLITVNLGSNNILGTLSYSVAKVFEYQTAGTEWEQAALEAIDEAMEENSDALILAKLLEAAKLMGQIKIVIDTAVSDLVKALNEFPASWDSLIARMRELNPNAPMVVISMANPLGSDVLYYAEKAGIDPEGLTMLADAAVKMTSDPMKLLNNYMQSGSKYSDQYIYIDNTDADFTASPDGNHLGPIGHEKLTAKIVAALTEQYEASICHHEITKVVNFKAATKFSKGYSGDTVCADCGQVLEKGSATTFKCMHEHTKLVGAIPSTYITLGFSGSVFCKDCGKLLELGHILGFKSWKK